MRTLLLLFAALLFVGVSASAQFADGQQADLVFGQVNFTANLTNQTGNTKTTAIGLCAPYSVAVDRSTGKVFVADASNNRIVRYPDTTTTNNLPNTSAAEAVLGQPTLTSYSTGHTSQTQLNNPVGVFVDAAGRLWVADASSSRVLWFNNASSVSSGASADGELGQVGASLWTNGGSHLTQAGMNNPYGVAVDASGNLYVADTYNSRVLRFNNAASKANGANADAVFGQPNFTNGSANAGGATGQRGMSYPYGVAIGPDGSLYVADYGNSRVMRFANAASSGNFPVAAAVLGEPDSLSSTGGTSSTLLTEPVAVAVDGNGTLYVSDGGGTTGSYSRIVIFDNASSLSTGAAASHVLGQTDLNASAGFSTTDTTLNSTWGLYVENAIGQLWVADVNNDRVIRFTSPTPPLPVELTSFAAEVRNGAVNLSWRTATEINNSGFEIQRNSSAGWSKVGFVQGHGTTNTPQNYSFTDGSVRVGAYSYRLKQIDHNGNFVYNQAIEATVGLKPSTVFLDNNYPNPFNPSTKISFVLGTNGHATLKVFNLLGQEVATLADGEFNGGDTQTFTFDASKLSSGIYYYQLKSGSVTQIKKMMLLK